MSVADSYPEASMASHPYFPPDLELPGYMANPTSVPILLALFTAGVGFAFSATVVLARTVQPGISKGKLYTAMWFMLCGCIHLFFEGMCCRTAVSTVVLNSTSFPLAPLSFFSFFLFFFLTFY
jgi:cholestenol delta-isomerase